MPQKNISGDIRFARWDGGPLEVAKAQLSGWYYMSDPKAIEATCTWYSCDTSLKLLRNCQINWIWVTFSVGFSKKTESRQWELLKPYVSKCRSQGISVMAYLSATNVFIDEMKEQHRDIDQWLQRDIHGGSIPYGAAHYGGEPTRMLTCLANERWLELIEDRAKTALNLGMEGLFYDNNITLCRCDKCTDSWHRFAEDFVGQHFPWPEDAEFASLDNATRTRALSIFSSYNTDALAKFYEFVRRVVNEVNPNALLGGNLHPSHESFAFPSVSFVSSEDAADPVVVDGKPRSNIGFLRCLVGAGAGWRPVLVEYGQNRMLPKGRTIDIAGVGAPRFVPMPAERHQLAMAEARSHGAIFEVTPEGEFLRDLFYADACALENWAQISTYQKFFAAHPDIYCNVRTATKLVALMNSGVRRMGGKEYASRHLVIEELANRGVVLDILYDIDLDQEKLKRYETLLLLDTRIFSESMTRVVRDFVAAGGQVIATGESGWFDQHFNKRQRSVLDALERVTWQEDPSLEVESFKVQSATDQAGTSEQENRIALSAERLDRLCGVLAGAAKVPVEATGPITFRSNVTYDSNKKILVHLLNYDNEPCKQIVIKTTGHISTAEILTPDKHRPSLHQNADNSLQVNNLFRYAVVVISTPNSTLG